MSDKPKLTVAGAAVYLGCTIDYVYRLLRGGKLADSYKVGKVWMIPQSALDQYRGKK